VRANIKKDIPLPATIPGVAQHESRTTGTPERDRAEGWKQGNEAPENRKEAKAEQNPETVAETQNEACTKKNRQQQGNTDTLRNETGEDIDRQEKAR
jgi:hypothetical protein